MNDVVARYEFRAFSQSFGLVADRIRGLAQCQDISESREMYLISHQDREHNIKVRGGVLEIKQLVEVTGGLERWRPMVKKAFPVHGDFVSTIVLPALGLSETAVDREAYTLEALIDQIVRPLPQLLHACVFKRRFRFNLRSCPAEMDETGLGDYEQVSYPLAIRRIAGIERIDGENQYGT